MKKRRVGTISMAIVLIAFGIIIFISQINSVSAVKLSVKFWPIILFLIGGEILWYSYKYKDEDVNIKYDVFSIFIVLLIVVMNLGIYGLIETNMIDKLNARISSQTFTFEIPYDEIEVSDEIEKIIVDAPNFCNLIIRSGGDNKVVSSGSIHVTADSKEKAKELSDNKYIVTNKSDNILYISFMGTLYNEDIYNVCSRDFTLTIPENKKVEINGGNDLKLIVDDIKNDWIVDDVNRIKIRLGKDIDAKINAFVYSKDMLRGNVKWAATKEKNGEEVKNVKGQLIYGEGKNSINILNSDDVVVDEVE